MPQEQQQQQHEVRSNSKKQNNNRSKSQDPRKGRMFSNGAGWFNPGQVWREADQETRGLGGGNIKQNGHWLLRERDTNLVSMPPNIDTLRDSGIGKITRYDLKCAIGYSIGLPKIPQIKNLGYE